MKYLKYITLKQTLDFKIFLQRVLFRVPFGSSNILQRTSYNWQKESDIGMCVFGPTCSLVTGCKPARPWWPTTHRKEAKPITSHKLYKTFHTLLGASLSILKQQRWDLGMNSLRFLSRGKSQILCWGRC